VRTPSEIEKKAATLRCMCTGTEPMPSPHARKNPAQQNQARMNWLKRRCWGDLIDDKPAQFVELDAGPRNRYLLTDAGDEGLGVSRLERSDEHCGVLDATDGGTLST
jgi:hypothetical protein